MLFCPTEQGLGLAFPQSLGETRTTEGRGGEGNLNFTTIFFLKSMNIAYCAGGARASCHIETESWETCMQYQIKALLGHVSQGFQV